MLEISISSDMSFGSKLHHCSSEGIMFDIVILS